jgi:hypothetical protein
MSESVEHTIPKTCLPSWEVAELPLPKSID